MSPRKLLMISTDRLIFDEKSAVRARQIEYAKNYDEVHIIVFTKKSIKVAPVALENEKLFIYPTESFSIFMYPFDTMKIGSAIIKKIGITEITCQDPFLTAMAGVALKRKFDAVTLEIQVHTDIGSPYYSYKFSNKIRKFLAIRYLPKADHIRVVSERVKGFVEGIVFTLEAKKIKNNGEQVKKILPTIEVRPIEVNSEWIQNAPIAIDLHSKYPQFEKIVLMASRLEPEKDISLAIKAWCEVIKAFPKAGLIIVGNGTEISKIKKEIQGDSKDSILIEPWTDQPTLASYYKTADLFLNTSLFEGYGMTLAEAKAAGCRIVSTDVGIAKEAGAYIVEHEPNSVAKGIIEEIK